MDATQRITKNLGGNRLGSGDKNNVSMHAYNRSTHDLSRAWRSSMNVGTLVPFMKEPALNGDTWSINLREMVRTVPAIGPLYGSYKLQLDVFNCPIRLYNGLLHNNMTNIGLNMSQVKLPKIKLTHRHYNPMLYNYDMKKSQISNDCLIKYLGLSGIGDAAMINEDYVTLERSFNAVPILAYWDIYKNYYANKQEKKGYYIAPAIATEAASLKDFKTYVFDHGEEPDLEEPTQTTKFYTPDTSTIPTGITISGNQFQETILGNYRGSNFPFTNASKDSEGYYYGFIGYENVLPLPNFFERADVEIVLRWADNIGEANETTGCTKYALDTIFPNHEWDWENNRIILGDMDWDIRTMHQASVLAGIGYNEVYETTGHIQIKQFELENIDQMRIEILRNTGLNNEVTINDNMNFEPFVTLFQVDDNGFTKNKYSQNGLGLKTYQSDLLNSWLQTEWIDGPNGINEITAIDVSSGSFKIDALNLANKVYNMLNRIAVSGGTYEDWQEAVYSTKATRRAETPIYCGGLSAEVVFEEVISTAETENNALGTLAGRGTFTNTKGGVLEIHVDEPSYIIGIASITPRIDYSTGNDWDMCELDTIDDLHKPGLDGIGFENLLQERGAWWGTYYDNLNSSWVKLAIGKTPAWINYMTSLNKTFGDFADEEKCMYMTLNRRYEMPNYDDPRRNMGINDMTTYINPTKYNYSFADNNLEAQNFWVQIGLGIECRRVMSAKTIPYL